MNITAERVLTEVAAIACSDFGDYFNSDWKLKDTCELPAGLSKVISRLTIRETTTKTGETVRTVRITLCDKLGALDELMKHLQLYQEQPSVLVGYDWAAEMEKRRARAKRQNHLQQVY